MPGDTSALLVHRLSKGPDLSVMEPMDLGGLAGAFLGGQEAGRGLASQRAEAKRNGVSGPGVGDYAGGFARGILRGRAIQKETEDPLGAIKLKLGQQNVQMGAIQLEEALRRRDDTIKGRAAASAFTPLVTDAIKNGMANDPATQQQILDWLARNPESAADPNVQNQLKLFSQSRAILEQQEKQRKALDAAKQALEGGMEPDEMTIKQGDITTKFSNPALSQQYAPANVQKELNALNDAYQRKDKDAIVALRSKLKLDELSPVSKQQFDAEIDALDRDFKLTTKPQEYLQKRLEIIQRYFNMAQQEGGQRQGGQSSKVPPGTQQGGTNPPPTGQRFRPDFKTGKLVPVK